MIRSLLGDINKLRRKTLDLREELAITAIGIEKYIQNIIGLIDGLISSI